MLQNRSFAILMAGEIVFGTGLWISIIANLQFMQGLVPSDFVKGLILMAGLLVSVLFAPYAGTLIDKSDKRNVMIASSVVRMLAPLCMFPALAHDSVAWMVLSLVLMQTSNSFYVPAAQAAVPAIVPADRLLQANSVFLNITTLSRIAGTAIGGVLLVYVELSVFYLASLLLYALFTGLLFLVKVPRVQSATRAGGEMRFREVLPQVMERPAVLVGFVNMSVLTLFLGGFNLLVINFSEYQNAPELMGWIYAAEGSSILLAGLFSRRLIGGRNLVTASTFLMFVFAASFFVMSFAGSKSLVLAAFALFGGTVAFFFPMVSTIFQKQLPPDVQGRFFSFKGMMDRILFQVALLATGACLDLIGISAYMVLLALLCCASGAVTLLYARRRSPVVRQDETATVHTA